jgi:hypothetical protein
MTPVANILGIICVLHAQHLMPKVSALVNK